MVFSLGMKYSPNFLKTSSIFLVSSGDEKVNVRNTLLPFSRSMPKELPPGELLPLCPAVRPKYSYSTQRPMCANLKLWSPQAQVCLEEVSEN